MLDVKKHVIWEGMEICARFTAWLWLLAVLEQAWQSCVLNESDHYAVEAAVHDVIDLDWCGIFALFRHVDILGSEQSQRVRRSILRSKVDLGGSKVPQHLDQ